MFRDLEVNRDTLDQTAPNNPVILSTFTSHAWIVNSAALAQFGIRADQPDPLGGRFERSPDGRLTGVIREYALEQVWRNQSSQTSEADALRELRETFSAAVKWGITTIQDMDNDRPPDRCIALLEKLPVPIRVRVIRMPGTTPAGRDIQEGRPVPRSSNPLIMVSGTKWLLDGTPLEGTFAPRKHTPSLRKKTKAVRNQESSLTWPFCRRTFSRLILRSCLRRNRCRQWWAETGTHSRANNL